MKLTPHLVLDCCPNVSRSRLTAAFIRIAVGSLISAGLLTLSGCTVLENSPTGQAIAALNPTSGQATPEQAESIAFASIALNTSTQRGLVVLGAHTGEQTHWPVGEGGFLSLYQGGLYAVVTPAGDLLTTHYRFADETDASMPWQLAAPATFSIERHWVDEQGLSYALKAEGRLKCDAPQRRTLLLAELPLQACQVTYTWDDGQVTHAEWWRDPATLRLWEVKEPAWPQGPMISWQVARPWWGS